MKPPAAVFETQFPFNIYSFFIQRLLNRNDFLVVYIQRKRQNHTLECQDELSDLRCVVAQKKTNALSCTSDKNLQHATAMPCLRSCVLQQVAVSLHIVQNRYNILNLPPDACFALPVLVAVNFDLENNNIAIKVCKRLNTYVYGIGFH